MRAGARYNNTMAAWDVVNEALCDCNPLQYETCADYFAGASAANTKCGWSERYGVYLKRNVFWPDLPDYIDFAFNAAKNHTPHQLMGYNGE